MGIRGFAIIPRSWRSILEDAKSKICSVDRVLCGILIGLKVVEARGLGSLGVTRDGTLLVDPQVVQTLTLGGRRLNDLVRVLVHEALHVLFLHPQRCERLDDIEVCNVAADAIVEAVIERGVRGDRSLTPLGIYDVRGHRLAPTVDSFYEKCLEKLREILEKCGIPWRRVPDYTLEQLYQELMKCLGARASKVKRIDAHVWRGRGGGGDKLEEISRVATHMAREASKGGLRGLTGKLPGVAPGEFEKLLILHGFKVFVDWRQVLQKIFEKYIPSDYTWRTPSRRSEALRVHLPGVIKKGRKVAVILDTSGSIEDKEYIEFLNALRDLLIDKPVETIVVAQADVKVQRMEVFHEPPPPYVLNWLRLRKGYGGTDFARPLREVLEKHPDIDLVIYFTDGYGTYPERKPPTPVIWVISREGVTPDDKRYWPPWGEVVKMT